MARSTASMMPAGSRIPDYIRLGVIMKFFPAEKVREILKETRRASIREGIRRRTESCTTSSLWRCTCVRHIAKFCAVFWKACSSCWTLPPP